MILSKKNNKNKKSNKHIINKKRKTQLTKKRNILFKNHKIIKANNFLQKYYVKSKYHLPMFHKIINKNGGGELTEAENIEFYDDIINLVENTDPSVNKLDIIQKHIDKILEVADNVVKKFEETYSQTYHTFKKINEKTISEILENIKKNRKVNIDEDKDKNILTRLNCISFQCVILFTELVKLAELNKFHNSNHFDRVRSVSGIPFNIYYNQIFKSDIDWDDYNIIIKDKNNLFNNYYNKPNVVLSLLGDLSLFQIIESYAKNIYIGGVAIDYINADGLKYTPFDFMNHDILIHKEDREQNGAKKYNFKNELIFIQKIKSEDSNPDLEPKRRAELYKITLLLFYIMHEAPVYENNLFSPHNEKNISIPIKTDFKLENVFSQIKDGCEIALEDTRSNGRHLESLEKERSNQTRFFNIDDLGGLLPYEFKDVSKSCILREKQNGEICTYLTSVCDVFNNEWNTFFFNLKSRIRNLFKFF